MTETRLTVRSPADGTELAVWADGEGPPLVLVHGSLSDHRASAALVGALRGKLTTFALDRRGFGASGDGERYELDHEFADVAAAIDAASERCGAPAAVWGHSFGGACALGGAALAEAVGPLILYEPSLGLRYPDGSIESVERLLAEGDPEAALVWVLRDIAGVDEEGIAALRAGAGMPWEERLAIAPTIPRECRAEHDWEWEDGRFDALTTPALLLTGSESPAELRVTTEAAAAALPDSRIEVLAGHGHTAHRDDPELVAASIRAHLEAN